MGPPPFGDGNIADLPGLPFPETDPSMGPPPFGDGNEAYRYHLRSNIPGLQWGHRLSAMETHMADPAVGALTFLLQWGHRLSAMETSDPVCTTLPVTILQWGHRLSAMETLPLVKCVHGLSSILQWGHRLSAMETR